MNKYPMVFASRHWAPQLSPKIVRMLRPIRKFRCIRNTKLNHIQVTGEHHLRETLRSGQRVMITPNHPSHADPFAIYEACDTAGTPCHIMAAWHVFAKNSSLMRRCLQWHGCFSIDREANDLTAFRQAVNLLNHRDEPLVIFPEGDIYHCNDRLTPFREGAAGIAIAAARRCDRPVAIVPTAIRYQCADDPTNAILEVLSKIEHRLLWRTKPHVPIVDRIRDIGSAVLGLKEQEFYGYSLKGEFPPRISRLTEFLLERLEAVHKIAPGSTVPTRVKQLRNTILSQMQDQDVTKEKKAKLAVQLDEVFLALQLFSYPGDYLDAKNVSIERIAETVDKLEEDVLQVSTASIRCRRNVQIHFGKPISVPNGKSRDLSTELTAKMEVAVSSLLDQQILASSFAA